MQEVYSRYIMNVSQRGEFGLIAHLHQGLATRAGTRLGIGDDGAVLDALKHPIVTVDALVENVHFRRDWTTPFALGVKSMAVNLSDLAAMGARPVAAFVALALPPDCSSEWTEQLYAGMESLAARYDFTVAGGDTTGAPLVFISVTLVGELCIEAGGQPLARSGARVGDIVCVTGNLGDSAAGLALLQNPDLFAGKIDVDARNYLLKRHFEPTPRLDEIADLMRRNRAELHAALDLSDGLSGDCAHIARASGVDIEIDAEQLPISDACRAAARALDRAALDWALAGGEDYELCLCVAPQFVDEFTDLIPIGRVLERANPNANNGAGEVRALENGRVREGAIGWRHF